MHQHYFNRLEQLDYLIRIKGTGPPRTLSRKLGVSLRTTFAYIEILKSLGAPISYCKVRQSYFYDSEGYFTFRFILEKNN